MIKAYLGNRMIPKTLEHEGATYIYNDNDIDPGEHEYVTASGSNMAIIVAFSEHGVEVLDDDAW